MAVEVQLAGSEEQPLEETVGPTEGWVACSAAACSVVGTVRERTVMAAAAEKAAGSAVEGDLAAVAGMQTEGVDLVLAVAVATALEIVIALETVVEHRWPGCSLLPAGADAASSSVASASP